jgi:hypothetical protein
MYGIIDSKGNEFIKCKGFPAKIEIKGKKQNLFKYETFEKALLCKDLSSIKYKTNKISTPFQALRRYKTFVSMTDFKKSIKCFYDKREVLDDFRTKPLFI